MDITDNSSFHAVQRLREHYVSSALELIHAHRRELVFDYIERTVKSIRQSERKKFQHIQLLTQERAISLQSLKRYKSFLDTCDEIVHQWTNKVYVRRSFRTQTHQSFTRNVIISTFTKSFQCQLMDQNWRSNQMETLHNNHYNTEQQLIF